MKRTIKPLLLVLVALLAATLTACGGEETPASVADGVTQVSRQVLAEASPETTADQLLELTRVIIPAGQSIAPHTHPGPQLAVIVEGTLTYTVIEGEVMVSRAAGTGSQSVETYGSGQTARLSSGDALVETPGMVHKADNETDGPVVIYLSSLFPQGAPPSSPAP